MTAPSRRKGLGCPALFFLTLRRSACALILAASSTTLLAQVRPAYLYTLSNFGGPLRYDWVRVQVDRSRDEAYVIYQNVVRVFNPSGMQIFSFGEDLNVGQIVDVAVNPDGSMLLLSSQDSRTIVTRCNYRGLPIGRFEITKLPAGVPFRATRLIYRDGLYYFVSLGTSSVIVTDVQGEFRKNLDLLTVTDADEKRKTGAEISGFAVDGDGNLYFTVSTLFKVFKVSADGTVTAFGASGSGAGKFGVVAGIAVDSRGNILVADKLKCVVMVFDKSFRFLAEFGYRGERPQNLILPDDLAIDSKDRVYVSQARRRGVSVFAVNPE